MEKRWIDQNDITSRKSLPGQMIGGMMAVYVKKFEILQKETVNSAILSDCLPIIMDLITCELKLDKVIRQSLFQSLIQMVISSETVVKNLSASWKKDELMRDLLRVMREHVMTQYKYYQLYTHNMVIVIKCLAQLMKNSKAKENQFIKTTYLVSQDRCTMLDVLLKPMHYIINMNKMFNDLGCMLLNKDDTNYISEIKRYLTQVFNKIQNKLDVMSEIINDILKRYENRCEKRKLMDDKWKKFKEKLIHIFQISIVKPCSFTLNIYLNYYFPSNEKMKEYLNNLV